MSNLRPAPMFLRPSIVRQLIRDTAEIRKGVEHLQMLALPLVDQPKPSVAAAEEVTRFDSSHEAASNDDIADPVEADATGGDSEPGLVDLQLTKPESEPVQSPLTCNGAALDWPDAPLPEHADPDLDRPENDPADHGQPNHDDAGCHDANQREECHSRPEGGRAGSTRSDPCGREGGTGRQGSSAGRVLRSDGGADGRGLGRSDRCGRDDHGQTSSSQVREDSPASPSEAGLFVLGGPLPEALVTPSAAPKAPRQIETLRNLGRRRDKAEQPKPQTDVQRAEVIRAVAKKLEARKAAPSIDWARVAAAHRNHQPKNTSRPKPTRPAPSRDECPHCGIPGWRGCDHFLPCEEAPPLPPSTAEKMKGARRGRRRREDV